MGLKTDLFRPSPILQGGHGWVQGEPDGCAKSSFVIYCHLVQNLVFNLWLVKPHFWCPVSYAGTWSGREDWGFSWENWYTPESGLLALSQFFFSPQFALTSTGGAFGMNFLCLKL
jgi:hypothetical protein